MLIAKITGFLKLLYGKLFKINDTPPKIALGFGLGVFLGVLPGTGPVAAFILASFLKINRASALLGSLLTNTWISLFTFILSLKMGAYINIIGGGSIEAYYANWKALIKEFQWQHLFQISTTKIILPVILGYLIISLILGIFSYFITLLILKSKKRLV